MGNIVLGIVADDFSGASDAASFLVEQGIKTLLFNGVPNTKLENNEEKIAVVVALKTRTEETKKAVEESLNAFTWLRENGAEQLYVKYCSTFDSTREGNIGPIIDGVLEANKIKYTIIAPALPVNGREVVDGHLMVNGVPLNETHMKDHPLTPMWDSDLSKLIEPQGKYASLKITHEMYKFTNEEILKIIDEFGHDKEHFYVIPDYFEEKHAEKIVELFGDLGLLTGGSGLMTELGRKYRKALGKKSESVASATKGKGIILAGSCSAATLGQIEAYKRTNGMSIRINPLELINGQQTKEDIWNSINEAMEDSILVYSSDKVENVRKAQEVGTHLVSELLEQTTAFIAKKAVENGFNRIIVAGGETSGAVTKILGYNAYQIGESIAPGVPIMVPLENNRLRLVLKSGNFGQEDFFTKATDMTKENQNG